MITLSEVTLSPKSDAETLNDVPQNYLESITIIGGYNGYSETKFELNPEFSGKVEVLSEIVKTLVEAGILIITESGQRSLSEIEWERLNPES